MKKWLLALALLLLLPLALLAWSFLPATLGPLPQSSVALPTASPPPGMSLNALPTGSMQARALLAYRGGAYGDQREFAMTVLLVRHPRGDLLVDAGFGRAVDEHVAGLPWVARAFSRHTAGSTAAAQLQAQGLDPATLAGVILTHAHWDHVSGLDSLPGVPVWTNAAEADFIEHGAERTALARRLGPLPLRPYPFDGGPYLGFAQHHDVWGDGSVVIVPAPGHTPGSVIVFLALPSGTRYALLGDLVWQREGIELPAERPWLARSLADSDPAAVRSLVLQMAALQRQFPDLRMVPAHDARAFEGIPVFPQQME